MSVYECIEDLEKDLKERERRIERIKFCDFEFVKQRQIEIKQEIETELESMKRALKHALQLEFGELNIPSEG